MKIPQILTLIRTSLILTYMFNRLSSALQKEVVYKSESN